jgi:acetyltransferase-like isoleucine patch superfamily enzyme
MPLLIDDDATLSTQADINATTGHLEIGFRSDVRKNVTIDCGQNGRVRIGAKTVIHPFAMLMPHEGEIVIGDYCTVNPFCVLYGHGGLSIGNYVRIATHTVMIPANHVFDDPDTPITKQGLTMKGIRIEDDVWIGAGVRILDGVTIGKGAVIAAGAVVNKSVPPGTIFAGVPAKAVGRRDRRS